MHHPCIYDTSICMYTGTLTILQTRPAAKLSQMSDYKLPCPCFNGLRSDCILTDSNVMTQKVKSTFLLLSVFRLHAMNDAFECKI